MIFVRTGPLQLLLPGKPPEDFSESTIVHRPESKFHVHQRYGTALLLPGDQKGVLDIWNSLAFDGNDVVRPAKEYKGSLCSSTGILLEGVFPKESFLTKEGRTMVLLSVDLTRHAMARESVQTARDDEDAHCRRWVESHRSPPMTIESMIEKSKKDK